MDTIIQCSIYHGFISNQVTHNLGKFNNCIFYDKIITTSICFKGTWTILNYMYTFLIHYFEHKPNETKKKGIVILCSSKCENKIVNLILYSSSLSVFLVGQPHRQLSFASSCTITILLFFEDTLVTCYSRTSLAILYRNSIQLYTADLITLCKDKVL